MIDAETEAQRRQAMRQLEGRLGQAAEGWRESILQVLALLADGEAWSSSALALALGVSPRTVQRALDALAESGKVESFGRGRACRWTAPRIPGFPTSLLLPAPLTRG